MRRPGPEAKVTSKRSPTNHTQRTSVNSPVVSKQFDNLFGRGHVNGGGVGDNRRKRSPYSLNVHGERNENNDYRNTSNSPISVLEGESLFEAQLTSEMNNRGEGSKQPSCKGQQVSENNATKRRKISPT